MQNPADYRKGYTTTWFNEKTGKYCSGGAARNGRIGERGGLAAIEDQAQQDTIKKLSPYIESLQAQLARSQAREEALIERYEAMRGEREVELVIQAKAKPGASSRPVH
ncbi:hypothetical protein [Pseudomonas sp. TE3610]